MEERIKRGYLQSDFMYFHLKDRRNIQFEHHYHDFNKIIVFINGNVEYNIEGKTYKLKPWDILFIPENQVHRPVIEPAEDYERIVIWINNVFLKEHGDADNDLLSCFNGARDNRHLIRLGINSMHVIKAILLQIENELKNKQFGSGICGNALFVQFMVYVNRLYITPEKSTDSIEVEYDEQIQKVIRHINGNLDGDLSISTLADMFFINKYYLMHKFKANTGFSIHNYVVQKRIQKGAEHIRAGISPSEAAGRCGFNDYSSFVRAFTKLYGTAPKKFYKAEAQSRNVHIQIEG